jgi:uncharacterized protein (TIGR00730 family)
MIIFFSLFNLISPIMISSMAHNPLKAYDNQKFLNGHDARSIRVLCELIEPDLRLKKHGVENTIVFFGSARPKPSEVAQSELSEFSAKLPSESERTEEEIAQLAKLQSIARLSKYYDQAVQLSAKLTEWSEKNPDNQKYFICSGGGPGMMEAANKGANEAGGKSIALGISLPFEQGVNPYADSDLSFEFHYFFLRKFYFLYHAKAVVVFPGGFGTMDELFETLTLAQTNKLHKKMPVFLYGKEFWDGLINFDHFIKWGVISPGDVNLFRIVDDVDDAFAQITASLHAHS